MKVSKFSDAQKAFVLKQGADGVPVADICRKAGISQATYFNWKKKYDGMLPLRISRATTPSFGLASRAKRRNLRVAERAASFWQNDAIKSARVNLDGKKAALRIEKHHAEILVQRCGRHAEIARNVIEAWRRLSALHCQQGAGRPLPFGWLLTLRASHTPAPMPDLLGSMMPQP